MEKLEEMQWCVVRQKNGSEPEGKCLQNCDQTSTVVWYRDLATARGQEARLEVNEMRMLRWMCGVTTRDKAQQEWRKLPRKCTEKRLKWYGRVMRMKEE